MIKVTDHALLRYIQRVHGIDIEAVRTQIAERLDPDILQFSDGAKIKINTSECTLVVQDFTVITVTVD